MASHIAQAVPSLELAKPFHDQGFALHLLHARQKRPIGDKWSTKPRASWAELQTDWRPDLNLGLRLGEWSKIGDLFLHVIDMDIRKPEKVWVDQAHAALDAALPVWRIFPSVISGSVGESRHIYFLTTTQFASKVFAHSVENYIDDEGKTHWFWELELLGTGKQVVFPGSIHPKTGLPYRWEREFDFDDLDMGLGPYISPEVVRAWAREKPIDDLNEDDDLLREVLESTLEDFDLAKAKATLSVFPAGWWDERDTWRNAGMALQHQFDGSDEAFDLWCELSKRSTKFDVKVQRSQWKSFKPKPGGITMRSIIAEANAVRLHLDEAFDAAAGDDEDLIGDLPNEEKPKADTDAPAGRDPGGDYALSRAFAAKVKSTMRFDRAARHFMAYSDAAGAWRRCERGEEEQAMLECARRRFNKACTAYRADPCDANKSKLAETTGYLKNANLLTRALGMAKSHPELVCLPTDFNTDPYSFPVANGLVDLRSGKLTPPSADLMISKQSPVRFDPVAVCPKFDEFMQRIMPDPEVRKFLQVAVGYTITGLVDEERLFLCHGKGANGKSVFANIIAALMGESTTGFSITVDPLTFVKGSRAGESERNVVSLIGKRLCLVNEIPQGSVWDDGKVKLLTSREQIAARHLYAENVNFWPSHTMWVRANSLPGAHDASDGFWRRVVPVPFTTQIPEAERIGDLDRQIMREELPGVLNWALAGAREYLATGRLVVPKSLSRLTAQYRESCDVFGQWLDDCVIPAEGARLPSSDAYRAYKAFCADQGVRPSAQVTFSHTMGDRGFPPTRGTAGARYFPSLKLRNGFDDYCEAAA